MLAQLDAASDSSAKGLSMGELSRRLMVTNGNLTGLTERLVKEGLVTRTVSSADRRQQRVKLTANGRRALAAMIPDHRRWINDMFCEVDPEDVAILHELIGKLKESVQSSDRRRIK
jgi:DNA-binding MarR family transcriptional regulator